jgi:hypothetical protein
LRVEGAGDGIKVVLIERGGLRTHIWEDMEAHLASRSGSRYESQYRRVRSLAHAYMAVISRPEAVARGHRQSPLRRVTSGAVPRGPRRPGHRRRTSVGPHRSERPHCSALHRTLRTFASGQFAPRDQAGDRPRGSEAVMARCCGGPRSQKERW